MISWWLENGVIVDLINKDTREYEQTVIIDNDISYWEHYIIIPRGVPFDCMPEWANCIHFEKDGSFWFEQDDERGCDDTEPLPFSKCPEKWKGNTYFRFIDPTLNLFGLKPNHKWKPYRK